MKTFNPLYFTQSKNSFQGKLKTLFLLVSLIIASQTSVFSQVSFEGSWGVTFPIFGGERLDSEIANEKDYISGAQEIVDEIPTAGHVITNLSYFAHSHYFNTRSNTNVDVANEIHPAMIPSVANDGVAVEAIQLLRNSGKKIILYISTNYLDRATGDLKTGWENYYNTKFGGNEYLAYRHLIQGFVEAAAGYADGYWLDTTSALRSDGNFDDFVAMIRQADPTALVASGGASKLQHEGEDVYVDSDGVNDTDPTDYEVKLHDSTDGLPDFTDGHIVPLATGAPPNSWSYEEFMIPNIMVEPFYTASNGKKVQKHGWFPIRERWHSPQVPIVFNTEEAYRFVRRITDYGGMITFANTNQTPNLGDGRAGHMMSDEMTIMKEVNRRLLMNPKADYVPYTRPQGASLVGETQYIEFPDIPTKEVGDADFIAATATSGLTVSFTSSNTNVATIVNGKVRIVGSGKTTIRATQAGGGAFTSAVPAERPLVVTGSGDPTNNEDNLALNGTASQSGTQNGGIAAYAIDGNTNGAFGGDSVIAATGPNAWWEVDLGNEYSINEVHVYNRTDACCIGRLTNFTVSILDSNGNVTYSQTFIDEIPNPSMVINVPFAIGQTIRVQSNETPTMNLAEVEVYGDVTIKQDQVITFPSFPTTRVGDPDLDPGVTASSGLPITYTSGNTSVATIVNGKIRIIGEGQTNITATQAGNESYNAAPDRSRVLTVSASAIGSSTLVHITKRNATSYAIDGNWGGVDGQNIYLYSQNPNNENQQWLEVDRGNGYYSYQKMGTNFCIDGNNGGENRQNVYLYTCIENNQNQHWQKVDVGGGAFKLIKRNAPEFALDGGSGGSNEQNVALWNSSSTSQNLHWIITPVADAKNIATLDTGEALIYPNPVSSTTATIQGAADSIITIYDMNGSLLLSQSISSESETLDLSLLSTGMYYAEVIGEASISVLKIVKK